MAMLLGDNFADREFKKIMHILDWLVLKILLDCRVILQSQALKALSLKSKYLVFLPFVSARAALSPL